MAPFLDDYFTGFNAIKNRTILPKPEATINETPVEAPPVVNISGHGLLITPLSYVTLSEERLMGPIELFSNLGGVAGLFCGISLISLVHMLFYMYSAVQAIVTSTIRMKILPNAVHNITAATTIAVMPTNLIINGNTFGMNDNTFGSNTATFQRQDSKHGR